VSAVLALRDVSKAYADFSGGEPRTLRGALSRRMPVLRRSAGRRRWALRDVSFALEPGRSLGLIGHNGAGKSTLLRLASGLGRPTSGTIEIDPDRASVLNLGASFDAQLSGEENAYTAALVSGYSRADARRLLAEILAFAELEEFASAPVRTYSEGMKLRLAFGVVAIASPRLLLLDEVLAVGDLSFRRRCEARIAEMQAGGTSLLLASHSLAEIVDTCQDALWLHQGRVRAGGEAAAVADTYERAMQDETFARTPVGGVAGGDDHRGALVLGETRFGSQQLVIEEVLIQGRPGSEPHAVAAGTALRIGVAVRATDGPVEDPIVGVTVRRRGDETVVYDLATRFDAVSLGGAVNEASVELVIDRIDIAPGDYAIDVGVYERSWEHAYDFHHMAYGVRVEGTADGKGLIVPGHRWIVGR
jgi:lipopolysaccharide transport system ATP-binding protein